jgi:hypothetical protein
MAGVGCLHSDPNLEFLLMQKSFTETVVEINEITQGNVLHRSFLLDNFFNNLPQNIQNQFKDILNKSHYVPRKKASWKCEHRGCTNDSCYSHEISENIFLKHLSDDNSKVIIFKRDMRNNPAFYTEEEVHKRDASNFPGYCSFHDAELFRDIENGDQELTDYLVNKQCLRTIRKASFEIEVQIKIANDLLRSIPDELLSEGAIGEFIHQINVKINISKAQLLRAKEIYIKIFEGIEKNELAVDYREIESRKSGYIFSSYADLTSEKDSEPCVVFLYKLDFNNQPKPLVCTLKNEISLHIRNDILSDPSFLFVNSFYHERGNLIFSRSFLDGLSDNTKNILRRDEELYEITPVERAVIYDEFF